MEDQEFKQLREFLQRVPSIEKSVSTGTYENGNWWVKMTIDIDNPLSWNVIQELGHVLNYLSLEERLPTSFYPVSPPPYMNGGPKEFLSWIIESTDIDFSPELTKQWLESRLPDPVEDIESWED
jgi:hypothetical protein